MPCRSTSITTELLTEHSSTPPTPFDELLGLCKKVREIDPNTVPIPLGNSERWKLNHYITMFNERVLGADGTAADYALTAPEDQLFTNPGYVEAWQKVIDMKDTGCWQDAPNATAPEASRAMFSAEQSPMIYCGTWCAGIFTPGSLPIVRLLPHARGTNGKATPMKLHVPEGLMVSAKTHTRRKLAKGELPRLDERCEVRRLRNTFRRIRKGRFDRARDQYSGSEGCELLEGHQRPDVLTRQRSRLT